MDLGSKATVRTISRADIAQKELIGSGSFGEVWRGKWTRINKNGRRYTLQVAIKIIKDADRRNVYKERDRMAGLNHPNIVKLLGIVEFQSRRDIPWLVLEYLEFGDLAGHIQGYNERNGSTGLCLGCFYKFALGTARGMEYLHSKGIVHGDLAARNCLVVGSDKSIKVGDLGYYDSSNSGYYSDYGTAFCPCPTRWTAPENLPFTFSFSQGTLLGPYKSKRSFEGDVWAYGVVLYEMLGKVPFETILSEYRVAEEILKGKKPTDFEDKKSHPCEHVEKWMHRCWETPPHARPTFSKIVESFDANGGHLCDDHN